MDGLLIKSLFKKVTHLSLSRIFFFKLELLLHNLLWKRVLSGALRAGKICRLCKRVRRRKKKQTPKNGCLPDCSITMGALPGAFMCESRAIFFFPQKNCRWIQLLKSGLQVVCVCFTTGESAKISSTYVFLKPWWVQEVAAGLEKYLGFKERKKPLKLDCIPEMRLWDEYPSPSLP